MKRLRGFVFVAAILLLAHQRGSAQAPAQGVAMRGPVPVPITADQVQKGRTVYDAHCASCHGAALSNGTARALTGREFRARWNSQSPARLRDYIGRQMPPGMAGTLSNDEYTHLVALLLKENGLAPGSVPLPPDNKSLVGMR